MLLPSSNEVEEIRDNFSVLVAWILVQIAPEFANFSEVIVEHISHKYSTEMAQKSHVVC